MVFPTEIGVELDAYDVCMKFYGGYAVKRGKVFYMAFGLWNRYLSVEN